MFFRENLQKLQEQKYDGVKAVNGMHYLVFL